MATNILLALWQCFEAVGYLPDGFAFNETKIIAVNLPR